MFFSFFFQAEDGIRDLTVTGVQTCALPIYRRAGGNRVALEIEGDEEHRPQRRRRPRAHLPVVRGVANSTSRPRRRNTSVSYVMPSAGGRPAADDLRLQHQAAARDASAPCIRARGRASDGMHLELGIRPDASPLLTLIGDRY